MATTNLRDTGKEPDYFSWLLRLWRVVAAGNTVWRASLEDPHTGEQRGFADLDELLGFLREQAPESQEKR